MSTPKFWRSTITGASMPTEPADLPEPVAYRHEHDDGWEYYDSPTGRDCDGCVALFTADQLRAAIDAERERWSELVEQLVACHEEPTCPAVEWAKDMLAGGVGTNVELSGHQRPAQE